MGHSSSGGYSSNPPSVKNNHDRIAKTYPVDNSGKLGVKDAGANVIYSDNPLETAKSFFKELGAGGHVAPLPNGKGLIVVFPDKSRVALRPVSSDGSPALEIYFDAKASSGYKIHFLNTVKPKESTR